ncbi:MAG: ribonuclease P protein component [Bacteroidetes bacterium]|nr:MAG: ribonuclease P protein component [Bacteroidota bacterium]
MEKKLLFPKQKRLCSQKVIQGLFSKSSSVFTYPFKIAYLKKLDQPDVDTQVLISVPKKNFKKAVDRNRIRRQIREIYRTEYQNLLDGKNISAIGIIFIAPKKETFEMMKKKLGQTLKKI